MIGQLQGHGTWERPWHLKIYCQILKRLVLMEKCLELLIQIQRLNHGLSKWLLIILAHALLQSLALNASRCFNNSYMS
jgi:hypothetical protein